MWKEMQEVASTDVILRNNTDYLEKIVHSTKGKLALALSWKLKKKYRHYLGANDAEKARACADAINAYDESFVNRVFWTLLGIKEKHRVEQQQKGNKRIEIDNSGGNTKDYYSVVLIVKNEARYIRELVIFYKATGADRIYIYDNDSTDNLLEELDPFLKSGLVVYRSIHGPKAQTYAYREAIRRSKNRTKWLAIIDADEFLFSPKGKVSDQLKKYEKFPGVGVNWVMFGPSGHETRPEGLLMDNYTHALADEDAPVNRHAKSIVQPSKVMTMYHTHYPIYKASQYAVNECGETIDNFYAYTKCDGRAFTKSNHRDIFRINHYYTKSLEDLREKCNKGYADGASNPIFEEIKEAFDTETTEDYTIKPYADIVREEIANLEDKKAL